MYLKLGSITIKLPQITELAKEFPDLTIILNHFSGPLGIGPYENKQAEIFPQWQKDLKELSQHENVYAKLGGLSYAGKWFWGFIHKPNHQHPMNL